VVATAQELRPRTGAAFGYTRRVQDAARELGLAFRAQSPLVVLDDPEGGERTLDLVRANARGRTTLIWTAAVGLRRDGEPQPVYGTLKLDACLDHIAASSASSMVYVLCGAAELLDERERAAKVLALRGVLRPLGSVLVLLGDAAALPDAVRRAAACVVLAPPDAAELYGLVNAVLRDLRTRMPVRMELDEQGARSLVAALSGLTREEARQAITHAILDDGRLSSDDLAYVVQKKRESVGHGGVLSFCEVDTDLDRIAGLARLKRWLAVRAPAFHDAARAQAFGLSAPRGVLLIGVQGCGKSASAKAIAHAFGLPLVRLDPSRVYDKFLGESDKNWRRALAMAERLAPVVLWIDEMEKLLGGGGGEDGGVSQRLLGVFLTWLAEHRAPVFVVATANDVSQLPPELLRKGRFDETFFLDLPRADVRAAIFAAKLTERGRATERFDLAALAAESDGFSGAEIEEAVGAALFGAFAEGAELGQEHLRAALAATRPLSALMAEPIAELRHWAAGRTVPADD
jgi:SpoVK/Ycf46/Vps4 family AAA+-type ATPase